MSSNKLNYLHHKKLNPADELRDLLNGLEDRRPSLKSLSPTQALIILRELDQIYALFAQLEAGGLDLSAERGRFESIQTQFRQNAGRLLKGLGGAAALSDHRPRPAPERERWWWYIHEIEAARQQHLLRRVVTGVIVVFVLVGAIYLAFNTILAPAPEVIARVEAENDAMSAFEVGDYQQAIDEIDQGLSIAAVDPGLLIMKGIFQELLDQDSEAVQTFALAQTELKDPPIFFLGRGQIYFRTGQFLKAESDARVAIELDDTMSAAWLLLGQALEGQGKKFESIPAYQQAGELALANGDNEVFVMARLALSRVGVTP